MTPCCNILIKVHPQHIESRRHRKFAENDAHFANLDHVLSRVKRRTLEEVRAENLASEHDSGEAVDDSEAVLTHNSDDTDWDEWMKSGAA